MSAFDLATVVPDEEQPDIAKHPLAYSPAAIAPSAAAPSIAWVPNPVQQGDPSASQLAVPPAVQPGQVAPITRALAKAPIAVPPIAPPSIAKAAPISQPKFDPASVIPDPGQTTFDAASVIPDKPKPEPGDTMRGVEVGWGQATPTIKGAIGLVGATAEKALGEGGYATRLKKWGLNGFTEGMAKLEPLQHESDDVTVAWKKATEGDVGAMVDWAQYAFGYGVAQVAQSAAVGIASGAVGGMFTGGAAAVPAAAAGAVAKSAAQGLIKSLVEKEIAKRVTAGATKAAATKALAQEIGAVTGLSVMNTAQEAGQIYPAAEEQATKDNRILTGSDIARIWGASTVAGLSETVPDVIGLGAYLGRFGKVTDKLGATRLGRAATGAAGGIALEAGQEGFQTAVEHYGAGQPIADEAGIKDIINSMAMAAVPGAVFGGAYGAMSRRRKATPAQGAAAADATAAPGAGGPPGVAGPAVAPLEGAGGAGASPAGPFAKAVATGTQASPDGALSRLTEEQAQTRADHFTSTGTPSRIAPDPSSEGHHIVVPHEDAATEQDRIKALQNEAKLLSDRTPAGRDVTMSVRTRLGEIDTEIGKLQANIEQDKADAGIEAKKAADWDKAQAQRQQEPGKAREAAAASSAQAAEIQSGILKAYPGMKLEGEARAQYRARQAKLGWPGRAAPSIQTVPVNPLAPKTVAGTSVALHTPETLKAIATDPNVPAITRHAAVAAIQALPVAVPGQSAQPITSGGRNVEVQEVGQRQGRQESAERVSPTAPVPAVPSSPSSGQRGPGAVAKTPEWVAFHPDTGTLGVPRAEMPQIKAEHRGAMVNFLEARGVTHHQEEVRADSLKPTQAEYSPAKVERAQKFEGGDRSILVSSDDYIVDGHHQAIASARAGESINIIRLNAPIAKLLPLVREFPSAQTAPGPKASTVTSAAQGHGAEKPLITPAAIKEVSVADIHALAPERRQDTAERARYNALTPDERWAERKAMHAKLHTDELTGIHNLRWYNNNAAAYTHTIAFDADSLSFVNNVLGHGAGDALIKAYTEAIVAATGTTEAHTAVRVGGDEFLALAKSPGEAFAIVVKVQQILRAAEITATTPDNQVVTLKGIGVSFGIGKDRSSADAKLIAHKQARIASGAKAATGQEPPGFTRTPAAGEQVAVDQGGGKNDQTAEVALINGKPATSYTLKALAMREAENKAATGDLLVQPAEPVVPAQNEFQKSASIFWMNNVAPSLRDYMAAFRDMDQRLETAGAKPKGMSATDWLMSFVAKTSTWDRNRKTGVTGIQALSQKDLWPTSDGKGEVLRKAMLASVKALKAAPSYSTNWVKNIEDGNYDGLTPAKATEAAPKPVETYSGRAGQGLSKNAVAEAIREQTRRRPDLEWRAEPSKGLEHPHVVSGYAKAASFQRSNEPAHGITESTLRSEIARAFGPRAANMVGTVIVPIETQAEITRIAKLADVVPLIRDGDKISGFYHPATHTIYAVLENLQAGDVRSLVMHESVHYGFEGMLGPVRYAQVLKQMDVMHRAGNKAVVEARAIAEKQSVRPDQVAQETLAYLIQERPELPWVARIISEIKAFLFRKFGILPGRLTADDIATLARASVLHASEGVRRGEAQFHRASNDGVFGPIGDLSVHPITIARHRLELAKAINGGKYGPFALPWKDGFAVVVDGHVIETSATMAEAEDAAKSTDAEFWRGEIANGGLAQWAAPAKFARTQDQTQTQTEAFKRWFGDWVSAKRQQWWQGLIDRALNDRQWQDRTVIASGLDADPSGKLSETFGFKVVKQYLTPDDIRKSDKKHGGENEQFSDQIGLTHADYVKALEVLRDPETFKKTRSRNGKQSAEFGRQFSDGTYVVVDVEVADKGGVSVKSAWKGVPGRIHAGSTAYPNRKTSKTAAEVEAIVHSDSLIVNPDSVSKVVDVEGKPLVMYHGTADDITAFDLDHPNRKDTGWLGTGVYLTTNADTASSYSRIKGGEAESNVMPLYAKLENPYYATQADKEGFMLVAHNKGKEAARALADKWTRELQSKGHDGVILDYKADAVGQANAAREIVVFDTAGVKSAIGNAGAFDPRNADIRFQRSNPAAAFADIDTLPRETQDDITYTLQTKVPAFKDMEESEVRANLVDMADPVVLEQKTLAVANVQMAPGRGISAAAVKSMAKLETAAPPILVDGAKLIEGGHRLQAAIARGDKTILAVDVGPLLRSDWTGWTDGKTNQTSPVRSNLAKGTMFQRSNAAGAGVDAAPAEINAPDWVKSMPANMQETLRKAGAWRPQDTLRDRIAGWTAGWQQKLKQGMVDQFDPIKSLDFHAYMLARMSKSAAGPLETMLFNGTVFLDKSGAVDVTYEKGGFIAKMQALKGEHDRFFSWVIGNRAERLMSEGREHNFNAEDIARLKSLNAGKMADGSARAIVYAKAMADLSRYNKAMVDMAEKAGLIDAESRPFWEKDFYIPFYRLTEGDTTKGPVRSGGLVRQYAFKTLNGGAQAIGDPMENVLRNWAHLIDASLKNQAAVASLGAAVNVGVAHETTADEKGSIFVMKNGVKTYYGVDDPFVLDAINSLGFTGFSGPAMKIMSSVKRWLTYGTTISPTFRLRNLIRDSISMIGTNPASYNVLDNVLTGWKLTKEGSESSASLIAGGGVIRFGTLEQDGAANVKRLVAAGVDSGTILDSPSKVKTMLSEAYDWWMKVGDRSENINRAAIYQKFRDEGRSHLEASYAARDTMDFSMMGTWSAIRFLAQTVPFFNARLIGMYKLGRGAAEDPRRFSYVIGAAALASIALLLAYKDDDDWKQREGFDRESYWWFKIGDKAFRIPKPFEIGAIGTLAERGLELMITDDLTGKQFVQRMGNVVGQQLSMNPIPQLFMPMIETWANRSVFTGRPIESQGMENLSPSERIGPSTSAFAQLAGKNGIVSPVNIDHLVNAYFGWLGMHAVATADLALRPGMGLPQKPAMRVDEMFAIGDFVRDMPAYQSKYVTNLYDEGKEVQQAMADMRAYQKIGATEKAAEIMRDQGDKIRLHGLYTHAEQQLTKINQQIKIAQSREGDADVKRARLDQLYAMKNRIARVTEQTAQARQQ